MAINPTTDRESNAVRFIEEDHANIHEGRSFAFNIAPSIVSGATYNVGVSTGKEEPHFMYLVETGYSFTMNLFEGSTFTGGTQQAVYNRNRNSTNTSSTQIYINPTITTIGTSIEPWGFDTAAAQTGSVVAGGHNRGEYEWDLKLNTQYIIQLTNIDNQTGLYTIQLNWYHLGY